MSAGFELEIENRVNLGKGHSRRLRRQGKVPAVLYGGGQEPKAITLDQSKLRQQMEQEASQTSVLTLSLGKETQAVVVKDVQRHPAKRQVLHLDFQRILEDEKITLQVPIHYTGQETAIGVKDQGGEIAILIADVEISCLPKDLPEFLEHPSFALLILPTSGTFLQVKKKALSHAQYQNFLYINELHSMYMYR